MVYKFFNKKSSGGGVATNLRDGKFIHPLETIFGVLI